MIRKIAVFGLSAVFLVGCGQDEADTAPTADTSTSAESAAASALFERIDADTPWLLANLEPVPEALNEKMWAPLKQMSEFNEQTYGSVADELDESPLAAAALREFAAIDSQEAFAERGLKPNGYWAIHAVSLFPFMHWELSDPDAFRAMLDRIAEDADTELTWREVEDAEVLWIDLEDAGLAISWDAQFVTAAIVPDDMALLRRVANLDEPATAFDPQELEDFASDRAYTPYGSGFIEFQRVVDQLLDSDDEMLAALREDSDLGEIAGDEACRSELDALVELFPRVSLGYTEMSEELMAFDMTVEADADFAERMRAMADTPVNIEGGEPGLFDFGLALNIVGARDFAREIVGGWVESPPQCALFAAVREQAGEWQTALNQPIPPVVTNFHGLRLSVREFELGEGSNIESAEGTLAMFMRNPQMMLGMAQMFSPELAALELESGGDPQPVPEGLIPNMPAGIPAFIGLGDASLGLAVGEGQLDRLDAAMDPGEGGNAVFSYGIDFTAYADALDSMMAGMAEQLEEMEDEGMPSDPGAGMRAVAELYDYTRASMHLTERGIEFRSSVMLRD